MENENKEVWAYTVHWWESLYGLKMKQKDFALKKEAIAFANRHYKEEKQRYKGQKWPKPVVTRQVTVRRVFRSDVEVEYLTEKEVQKVNKSFFGKAPIVIKC